MTTCRIHGDTYHHREHLRSSGWRFVDAFEPYWEKRMEIQEGIDGLDAAKILGGNRKGCQIISATAYGMSVVWTSKTFVKVAPAKMPRAEAWRIVSEISDDVVADACV